MPASNPIVFKTRVESRLKATKDIQEFKCVALNIVNDLGFSDFDFQVIFPAHEVEISLSTVAKSLVGYYTDWGIGKYDMMIEYVSFNDRPIFQSEIDRYVFSSDFKTERFVRNQKYRTLQDRYEFYDCLAIPIHSEDDTGKRTAVLTVYQKGKKTDHIQHHAKKHSVELDILASCFDSLGYERYTDSFHSQIIFKGKLTKKETQVLKLASIYGSDTKLIAQNIHRSPYTVAKHMENIRKKMRVHSTTEAVAIGLKQKII